jgi:hypothetical protein
MKVQQCPLLNMTDLLLNLYVCQVAGLSRVESSKAVLEGGCCSAPPTFGCATKATTAAVAQTYACSLCIACTYQLLCSVPAAACSHARRWQLPVGCTGQVQVCVWCRTTYIHELIPPTIAAGDVLRAATCTNFVYPTRALFGAVPPERHIVSARPSCPVYCYHFLQLPCDTLPRAEMLTNLRVHNEAGSHGLLP